MSSIFNVYVILRFRCAWLICIWHVVFFDTLYVFFFLRFFNILFLKLQYMRIKMYIGAVARTQLQCGSGRCSNAWCDAVSLRRPYMRARQLILDRFCRPGPGRSQITSVQLSRCCCCGCGRATCGPRTCWPDCKKVQRTGFHLDVLRPRWNWLKLWQACDHRSSRIRILWVLFFNSWILLNFKNALWILF